MKKKLFLAITLVSMVFVACKKDDNKPDDNNQNNTGSKTSLSSYSDVNFSLATDEAYTSGRFFSTSLGKSFKAKDISSGDASKIDLALYNYSHGAVNFFVSPNDKDYGSSLTGITATKYINYVTDQLSVAQFDTMTTDALLKNVSISKDDGNSFSNSLPVIVLFENAAGKKGAIKVKSITVVGADPKIVVDVKVQK